MNETLQSLLTRVSIPADMLIDPAPSGTDLAQIVQAAICVPDHGAIRPWRFLTITGQARDKLGEVFCEAALLKNPDLSEEQLNTTRAKALRSPLILTVIASVREHPKVSADEQIHSAAAAAQNVLLAANALGYGAIWLTGPFASDPLVCNRLGLTPTERIIAFVFMGTPSAQAESAKKKIQLRPKAADFIQDWNP